MSADPTRSASDDNRTHHGDGYQPPPGPQGRFLSKEECIALGNRLVGMASGGGDTDVYLESAWTGNIRWARNQITTCGDVRDNLIKIGRIIKGAKNLVTTNQISDKHLNAAIRRAERLLQQSFEHPEAVLYSPYMEPFKSPVLWFDRTYQLQADERAEAVRQLVQPAKAAGMLAAGYIEVSAHGRAVMKQRATPLYYPYTRAQYSVTVRDPNGTASGWAGVDWNDWGRVDAEQISGIALDKCLRSRNPAALEPGRYTTILEPQAVSDLVSVMLSEQVMDRYVSEKWPPRRPFSGYTDDTSKIGLQVIDTRLTISADPMDPDAGFPPYSLLGEVYQPVNWIEDGVLKELSYARDPYGIQSLGRNAGLPNSTGFRMSGGTATVDSMIANTKRGLLVTRFSNVAIVDLESLMLNGVTRDGLWLIENGKISKAVKNFRFTESPFVALNNVLELGVPQRVFRPVAPTVVPAMKVQDFSFTSMSDAI